MPSPSARPRRAILFLAATLCLLAPRSAWPQTADAVPRPPAVSETPQGASESTQSDSRAGLAAPVPPPQAGPAGPPAASLPPARSSDEMASGRPLKPATDAGSIQAGRFAPPRVITAQELAHALTQGGLTVVDLRPADQFADYHIPGAVNVELPAGSDDPARLPGDPASPVVLADRDGTGALVAATLLARRAERPLFVLQGGVTAWWRAEELGRIVRATPLPGPGAAPVEPAGQAPGQASPAPSAPSQPKTKSAGC